MIKMHHKRKTERAHLRTSICACTLILVLCACGFTYAYCKSLNEQITLNEIARIYHDREAVNVQTAASKDTTGKSTSADSNSLSVEKAQAAVAEDENTGGTDRDFAAIKRENSDFRCWLTVPGTKIDYPVMKNKDDAEYYLHRDFYKRYSYSGTPFMDSICEMSSDAVIIYAHNMKNGTMFGELDLYRDKNFWAANNELTIGTESGEQSYVIFGAFETSIYDKEFIYTDYAGTLNKTDFEVLVSAIRERTPYSTGESPVYGDKIIFLSTCSYHTDGGRYVVAAASSNP